MGRKNRIIEMQEREKHFEKVYQAKKILVALIMAFLKKESILKDMINPEWFNSHLESALHNEALSTLSFWVVIIKKIQVIKK